MITIKVPGRICFFGDHQDYLQLPIIAGTINRFITLTAQPIEHPVLEIQLPDLGTQKTIALPYKDTTLAENDYFSSGIHTLKLKGITPQKGFRIQITGDLPINAGLSSSSALVVAWVRFLLQAYASDHSFTNKEIAQMAVATEVTNFQQPGGIMDQFTIAHGGLGFLAIANENWHPISNALGGLVVALSGIKKQTLAVLQQARSFQTEALEQVKKQHPEFQLHKADATTYMQYLSSVSEALQPYWHAAIQNYCITQKAYKILTGTHPNISALGNLMNQHQTILRTDIQNTPAAMHQMMEAALGAGALGAKIIGSGGGGAMVAMVPKAQQPNVIAAFKNAGAVAAFAVEIPPVHL
jgi:galactokinase